LATKHPRVDGRYCENVSHISPCSAYVGPVQITKFFECAGLLWRALPLSAAHRTVFLGSIRRELDGSPGRGADVERKPYMGHGAPGLQSFEIHRRTIYASQRPRWSHRTYANNRSLYLFPILRACVMRKLLIKSAWLRRLLLMAILAPFVLFWGEIFTRTLLPQNVDSKMNIFNPDPVIGFTYKPNAKTYEKGGEYNAPYEINSFGLRDRDYGPSKEGVFRVLLLGDSFSVSHGLPIEDSLSRQMEKALQGIADGDGRPVRFEVINAAAGGYSPYNYWKAYRRWAPVFHPDAVIVGLSPDDYDCSNENARYLVEDGEILGLFKDGQEPKGGRAISIRMLRKWLSWNSELYILIRNFFYYNEFVNHILLWRNPGGVEDDSQLQLYMVAHQENMNKAWSKSFSYLKSLQKEIVADGVVFILIPIPLKMEINSEQYRQVLVSKGLQKEQIDLSQQLREISDFCRKENIPVLDPRLALRERQAEVACYFVLDGHWNAEGVRVAASALARQWRDLGLPPWATLKVKSAHQ
jgi:hypothetical protein